MTDAHPIIAFASTDDLTPKLLARVPAEDRARAESFGSAKRRTEFLIGRALLYGLLERHFGNESKSIELVIDGNGKPHCVGGPAINVSHTEDIVACALWTGGDIGIDLEIPRSGHNTAGIASRYFTPGEADWLAANEDGFFMLWVLKEAWLKATGKGLPGGLHSLDCRIDGDRIHAAVHGGDSPVLSLHAVGDALLGIATFAGSHKGATFLRWDAGASELVDSRIVHRIAGTAADPA